MHLVKDTSKTTHKSVNTPIDQHCISICVLLLINIVIEDLKIKWDHPIKV